jgi:hypothetical protein
MDMYVLTTMYVVDGLQELERLLLFRRRWRWGVCLHVPSESATGVGTV